MHMYHLGILLKCGFRFSRSGCIPNKLLGSDADILPGTAHLWPWEELFYFREGRKRKPVHLEGRGGWGQLWWGRFVRDWAGVRSGALKGKGEAAQNHIYFFCEAVEDSGSKTPRDRMWRQILRSRAHPPPQVSLSSALHPNSSPGTPLPARTRRGQDTGKECSAWVQIRICAISYSPSSADQDVEEL